MGNSCTSTKQSRFGAKRLLMKDKIFSSDCEMQEWIKAFFNENPTMFYEKGVTDLKCRWKKVYDNEG